MNVWNVVLWVAQIVLAAAFLMAGFMKVSRPIIELSKRMSWVAALPPIYVRFIGAAEMLGGVGLILPMLTGTLPWLTVAAAIGLAVLMVSAAIFHLSRNEASHVPTNVVLLLLALFVIIGRWLIVRA
jgi:putative oxidoreductase